MGTKVILLRSQDIFSDSRVLKYESLLKKENIPRGQLSGHIRWMRY